VQAVKDVIYKSDHDKLPGQNQKTSLFQQIVYKPLQCVRRQLSLRQDVEPSHHHEVALEGETTLAPVLCIVRCEVEMWEVY
jgi:hypothetical protein